MADPEEQCRVVVGKLDELCLSAGEQRLQLLQRLARHQRLLLGIDAGEVFAPLLDVRETMAVSGDHGNRLRLENQQGAVEGIAGFLIGNREDRPCDERAQ